MPRVHYLRAAKDYPNIGVSKGDMYYKWTMRMTTGKSYRSITRRSKTRPRSSQLTMSEYKQAAHALNERIEDFGHIDFGGMEDFIAETISEAESLRDEQQDKFDGMPESLQWSPTGQQIEERIQALENFISELEGLTEPDQPFDDEEPEVQEKWNLYMEELKAISLEVD